MSYILGKTPLILSEAQDYCLSFCGRLAEPNLTQADITNLHDGFVTQFANEITTSTILIIIL